MRGNKVIKKRQLEPDAIYNSVLVTKLINNIMRDGKKTTAQNVVYGAFERLSEKDPSAGSTSSLQVSSGQDSALNLFEKAVQNVGPKTEIKARRVGGASYQIPIEVRGDRRTALALRWIIDAARSRSNKEYHTFSEKLKAEILAAAKNEGEAVRKRDNTHRMAEANKAFSHFRI